MSSKNVKKPTETPVDEHEGMGGSYLLDPDTGLRTLVERTQPAEQATDKEVNDGTAQA